MLKERIQEIFEFAKSESPYRKANKGWINKDIFLDLNPSGDTLKQKNEAAKVTLFWYPINILLSNIFLIIILGSIFVFSSVSFAKGRFEINLFNESGINDIVKVDENKGLNISLFDDGDSTNLTIQQNIEFKELEKMNENNSLDYVLEGGDEEIITEKIDRQDTLIKESNSNKGIEKFHNKQPNSNFI